MRGRIRNVDCYQREDLSSGWQLCSTPPDAFSTPAELALADVSWVRVARLTAAGALRAIEKWSLDPPARRFDAEDWWFKTRFRRTSTFSPEVVLGFDGLATIAEVWLNGELLLCSSNMFVAHESPVQQRLLDENELVLCCRSLDKQLSSRRPRPRWKTPMVENQQLRWFRTTLLGRTPGWSPPAAPVGPWREVWLESRAWVSVTELTIQSRADHRSGVIAVSCNLSALPGAGISQANLVVTRGAQRWTSPLALESRQQRYAAEAVIPAPELWWPHTHGEPALYQLRLQITTDAKDGPTIEVDLGATGFRTIEVHVENDDFAVRINGERIFCRGACWTPLDIATLHADESRYRAALTQVQRAGMNMIRVGGTMVYESDAFLDLCDSLGILVWQDFMFANMDYPEDDESFINSIKTEVRQQLARLSGRPCLTVLCGNSEGEQQAAMWGAARDRWAPRLFHEILPALVVDSGIDAPYWPSSAHGGSFPHQANAGTASYYGVGAYLRPLEDARRSEVRFATECLAFANVPEDSSLAGLPGGLAVKSTHAQWKMRSPRDLGAGWDFDDVRDFYLQKLFDVDPMKLRYADHERYLELSRVVCGEVMAATFAEWRRKDSTCNGALIWFLKDFWPGAGWGIVDSHGHPKAPYYYLQRVLQPVALSISDEGVNGLFVNAINETAVRFGGSLELVLYKAGEISVGRGSSPLQLCPRSSVQIPALTLFENFSDLNYAYRFGPPSHHVVVARLYDQSAALRAEAFFFPTGLNLPQSSDLGVCATIKRQTSGELAVHLSCKRFAQSVTLAIAGCEPADQYFHMSPDIEYVIALSQAHRDTAVRGSLKALNSSQTVKIETAE